MRKLIFCLCCLLWAIPACAGDLELDLECLQEAYPGFITGTETDEAGHVWFLTKNGGRLLYDDGKMKSHAELLENADIEDAMRQPYPLEPERPDFAPDEEPGRIRCYPLLKALYGADQRSHIRCEDLPRRRKYLLFEDSLWFSSGAGNGSISTSCRPERIIKGKNCGHRRTGKNPKTHRSTGAVEKAAGTVAPGHEKPAATDAVAAPPITRLRKKKWILRNW
ncbi:hypothetical protein [Bilophila wadsworthia]|uniref:hypothetical protein n=1 Tax=Bilophila wadsworthia TaxID=35833 RepID=UPI0039905F15